MNRKQFVMSQGATCANWRWSWSFINEKEKTIIFCVWDTETEGSAALILNPDWKISRKGRTQPGYFHALEHIRLIEEEGYQLKTFCITYSGANEGPDGTGPAKIGEIIPKLTSKYLSRKNGDWYAVDNPLDVTSLEETEAHELFSEGNVKSIYVNIYERNSDARKKCIKHYGCSCAICNFNFQDFYGPLGEDFIHVHHLIPLSEIKKEYVVDPIKDLIPLCANCHAVIHRRRPALSLDILKKHLSAK